MWFIPLPGFWQIAVAGGLDELAGRCEEYLAAATTEAEERIAAAGVFSLLTLVNEVFKRGVRYFGVGVFRRDDGTLSTATLSLTTLDNELPDSGATQRALATIIESKWGADPLPLDVPAGPAMKWTGIIKAGIHTGSDAARSPELPEVHQASIAITHPETQRIVVLQCSTPDEAELENYQVMIEIMAMTVWFDGKSPFVVEQPEATDDASHIRSVLG